MIQTKGGLISSVSASDTGIGRIVSANKERLATRLSHPVRIALPRWKRLSVECLPLETTDLLCDGMTKQSVVEYCLNNVRVTYRVFSSLSGEWPLTLLAVNGS